jgi:protein-L-isoaspartate(D-aspartate) O-methyltransferase
MSDGAPGADEDEQRHRAELVLRMRQSGINDARVVRAMEMVPRRLFVPPHLADQAYADRALPVACGQTISQPYVVAYMTQHLQVGDRHKVLEIGTGTGYQTAILAGLARRVYSVDRYRTLVAAAEGRLASLRISNVTLLTADGYLGWPSQAPFDRILVTAAAEDVPPALCDQLADGGILIAPVGPIREQKLIRLRRTATGFERDALLPVRFVPLVPGKAVAL